ncbi:MAG TPA: glycosyltransferase [Longimicrobiales bacterium]
MIYICIPTYDEARTIGVMLWKIRTVMAKFPRDYQILVADDASTDATPEVLEPYTRILPLTIFRNEQRKGYAATLEMLLREAVRRAAYPKRDVIVTLQADFTDEPDEIPALVKRVEGGADVVTSDVRLGLEQAPRPVRWARRVLAFLLRRLNWPAEVSDPISGFRAYRVITVKRAMDARGGAPLMEWDGWAGNAALLRAVAPFARRIEEAPVTTRYDRRHRPTRFRAFDAGRDVLRFMRAARRNGHPTPHALPAGRRDGRPGAPDRDGRRGTDAGAPTPGARTRRGSGGAGRRAGTTGRRGQGERAEGTVPRGRDRGSPGAGGAPAAERRPRAGAPEGGASGPATARADAVAAEPAGADAVDATLAADAAPASPRPAARRSRGRRSGGGRPRPRPAGEAGPAAEEPDASRGDGENGAMAAGTGGRAEGAPDEAQPAVAAARRSGGSRRGGRRGGRRRTAAADAAPEGAATGALEPESENRGESKE